MRKTILVVALLCLVAFCFAACDAPSTTAARNDVTSTLAIGSKLAANQPTPTDIDYSLERYNLVKRTYWVNGLREKALTYPCPVARPIGYIFLITNSGSILNRFTVDGKVTSLNSYLTPDSEWYETQYGGTGSKTNDWLPDVDGAYGFNDEGIFFFTTDGNYMEWKGSYLYTDIPLEIPDPVLRMEGIG